jgi:hypothetical protein
MMVRRARFHALLTLLPGLLLGCTPERRSAVDPTGNASVDAIPIDRPTVVKMCSPETRVRFSGVIKLASAGGTLSYRWVRSDGTQGQLQTIQATGAAEIRVVDEWAVQGALSGWERLDVVSPAPVSSAAASVELPCQSGGEVTAIQTISGNYLTAVEQGGLGGSEQSLCAPALQTNATQAGPSETFALQWLDQSQRVFALKTSDGHYVTAVEGGGIGGPNDARSPVHTDATVVGPWELWRVEFLPDGEHVLLRTPDGHYVTAVRGGGIGGPNDVPMHTDAVQLGPWERFRFVQPPTSGATP